MTRTTPDRPFDLEALFPELTAYARTATRLHPRSGTPTVHESSVGGPLLWPADEPWPTCPDEHGKDYPGFAGLESVESIRRRRGTRSVAADCAERTEQEGALVPIAQLYVRDIPDLKAPPGADVLQVLWCPFDHSTDHGEDEGPAVTLRWRDSSAVRELLAVAPEAAYLEEEIYLPEPCVLHPEQVTEYPTATHLCHGLDPELCERIADWCRGLAGMEPEEYDPGSSSNDADVYAEMSACSTWKVGGLPFWSGRDPWTVHCTNCKAEMVPLLQIGSGEWFDNLGYWVPVEDLPAIRASELRSHKTGNPPAIELPRGYRLQIFVCPEPGGHPHQQYLL